MDTSYKSTKDRTSYYTTPANGNTVSLRRMMFSIVLSLQLHAFLADGAVELCGGVRSRFVCDDKDPTVFHICMGNNQYTMICPGMLHFNERTQNCDWPESVNCVQELISRRPALTEEAEVPASGKIVENAYNDSLPAGSKHETPSTNSSVPEATATINREQSVGTSGVTSVPESDPSTPHSRYHLKVIAGADGEMMPADDQLLNDIKALTEELKSVDNYVQQSETDKIGYMIEPYKAFNTRRLLPYAGRYIQSKSGQTTSFSPFRKIWTANPFIQNRDPSISPYRRNSEKFVSPAEEKHHSVATPDVKIKSTVSRTKDSYRRPTTNWYQNRITRISSTPRLRKTSRNITPSPVTSKTDKRRASYLQRGKTSWANRFRSKPVQKKDAPQKFSARLDSPHKISRNRISQKDAASDYKRDAGFLHTRNGATSKRYKTTVPNTHETHARLQPQQQSDALVNQPGTTYIEVPWWSTAQLRSNLTTVAHSVTSRPSVANTSFTRKHTRKQNIPRGQDKKHFPPSSSDQKSNKAVSKRLNRRKYKPRHHTPRSSYNTRSPFSLVKVPSSDRSTSYMSVLKQSKQNTPYINAPAASAKNSLSKTPINAPAAVDEKSSLHQLDTEAAEDTKISIQETFDSELPKMDAMKILDKQLMLQQSDNSSTNSFKLYKTSLEKCRPKTGKCSSSLCKLPECRCIGPDIPGGFDVKDVPQMVMLTFDDSINSQNMNYYKQIFGGNFKNPNGCPIRSTFFVSGDNSDYQMVKKIHKQGHEIASHTLSHRNPTTWWADAGYDNWEQEVVGMRDRLSEKSGVPVKEVAGMRAPFLQVGGDAQYAMLKDNKFRYDSSMVTGQLYSNHRPPIWPFTLDTPPDSTTCNLTPCPTCSYPGLWEIPLIRWYGSNQVACAMPDACTTDPGVRGSRKFLEENFNRHYTTNKAPLGIFIHASWFSRAEDNFKGLLEFLGSLADKEDVWVVTMSQALDWVQRPVRLSALNVMESWSC